ncbi:glycosyltransferase [Dactylosporangium sp. NPDC000244]|uniref:glycosyltransferase n=1 Tax=Dactylosporangium sp. NPDC000244 TaxID=3154365 RepID=UPI00331DD15F
MTAVQVLRSGSPRVPWLTGLRFDDAVLPAGSASVTVLCCLDGPFDPVLLRECRRVLDDRGVAFFGSTVDPAALSDAGFCDRYVAPAPAALTSERQVLITHAGPRLPAPPAVARSVTSNGPAQRTTMVIPVRNERRNLPTFFAFLENATNELDSTREFVVVVNGCNDGSEEVARDLAAGSTLDVRVVTSPPGIVAAFRTGISQSTMDGFVGKLDADVIVHPRLLDALESHLVADDRLWVTHAEPLPADSFSRFSEPDHRAESASPRRYFNGKASLYRGNPFQWKDVDGFAARLRAEDVFFSFYLSWFAGLDAIGLAPGAYVYQKTIRDLPDLVRMLSRTRSEIGRLVRAFPGFALLNPVFDQKVFSPAWAELLAEAAALTEETEEWLRLESTK